MLGTPSTPVNQRRISALTGLRGIAAVWVVLYHLTSGGFPVIDQGYLGVDVFFILSGYVLCYVYAPKFKYDFSFYFRFLAVRLARIYPLHAFTLAFLGVLVLMFPQHADRYSLADQRWGGESFIASLFLVQNWGHFLPTCWNTPAWSLSAEWFAYLAFPGFLLFTQWPRSPKGPLVLVCLLFAAYNVLLLVRSDPIDVHGTPGMLRMTVEFAAGCLLYRACEIGLPRLPAVFDAGAAVCLLLTFLFPRLNAFALLGFALMVLLAGQQRGPLASFLSLSQIVYLGEISYSVYLIHWPLIQLSNWFFFDSALKLIGAKAAVQASILGVIFVLSVVSHRWIELPARAWGRRLARSPLTRVVPVARP